MWGVRILKSLCLPSPNSNVYYFGHLPPSRVEEPKLLLSPSCDSYFRLLSYPLPARSTLAPTQIFPLALSSKRPVSCKDEIGAPPPHRLRLCWDSYSGGGI